MTEHHGRNAAHVNDCTLSLSHLYVNMYENTYILVCAKNKVHQFDR